MRSTLLFPALLALALCTHAAWAEKADREKEIVVNANQVVGDDANRVSTFDGDVVITQGTMRMTANKVTLREDPQGHKFYVAVGNPVTFREKRDNVDEYVYAYAQRAEFDDLSNFLHLYDKARVKSEQNEITGDYISYDMTKEVASVSGAPPGQTPPPNSRAKVVIIPPKKAADAKAASAKAADVKAGDAKPAPKPAEPGIQLKPDTAGPQ
jgi:lipopolysaccharide export system protein LptA